jgi:hypothetical protein
VLTSPRVGAKSRPHLKEKPRRSTGAKKYNVIDDAYPGQYLGDRTMSMDLGGWARLPFREIPADREEALARLARVRRLLARDHDRVVPPVSLHPVLSESNPPSRTTMRNSPLALTDEQLAAIRRAAEPLQPHDRGAFLQAVADALQNLELGDGNVFRAIKVAQKQFYDPPILSIGSSRGR